MSLSNNPLNESIPRGFTLIASDHYDFIIKYKRTRMGCMNIFLILWVSGWFIFCLFLTLPFLLNPRSILLDLPENLMYYKYN